MINVIVPTLTMSCFAFLSFLMPVDTRISLGLNIFVALSFLTSVISEETPISQETSVMNQFLIMCTVLTTLSVVFNVLTTTLRFYNRGRVPEHIAFLVFKVLAPLVGYDQCKDFYLLGMVRNNVGRKISNNLRKINNNNHQLSGITTEFAIKQLVDGTSDAAKLRQIKDFWRCMAQTLDRSFFALFVVFLFAASFPILKRWKDVVEG